MLDAYEKYPAVTGRLDTPFGRIHYALHSAIKASVGCGSPVQINRIAYTVTTVLKRALNGEWRLDYGYHDLRRVENSGPPKWDDSPTDGARAAWRKFIEENFLPSERELQEAECQHCLRQAMRLEEEAAEKAKDADDLLQNAAATREEAKRLRASVTAV